MKKDQRAVRRAALKRRRIRAKADRERFVCCEYCLRNIPGRFGRADKERTTARFEALRDQLAG